MIINIILNLKFLIIFIFLITNSLVNENPNIKNLVIISEPKKQAKVTFLDSKKTINLDSYRET